MYTVSNLFYSFANDDGNKVEKFCHFHVDTKSTSKMRFVFKHDSLKYGKRIV